MDKGISKHPHMRHKTSPQIEVIHNKVRQSSSPRLNVSSSKDAAPKSGARRVPAWLSKLRCSRLLRSLRTCEGVPDEVAAGDEDSEDWGEPKDDT